MTPEEDEVMTRLSKLFILFIVTLLVAPLSAGQFVALAHGQEAQEEQEPAGWLPQEGYQLPPPVVQDLLERDPWYANLDNLGPDGDHFIVPQSDPRSTLELMSKETYRLAGLEFRPLTNREWRIDTYGNVGFQVYSLSARAFLDVDLPDDTFVSDFVWSPEGDKVAFLAHLPGHTEVWVANVHTGTAESLASSPVNATIAARSFGGGASNLVQWTPDGKVITLLVPPGRGPEPVASRVPSGPVIQSTREEETTTRTIPFLLQNEHDAALFEYYTTSQIAELAPGQEPRLLGEPGMFTLVSVSPDGDNLLTTRIERPFSYITGYTGFPQKTEVLDADGNVVSTVFVRPLREGGGRGDDGNNLPRELGWRPDGKGLTFLQREPREEADEAGNSDDAADAGAQAAEEETSDDEPRMDRVMLLDGGFIMDEAEVVAETEESFSDHSYSLDGGHLFANLAKDGDRALATWTLGGDGLASGAAEILVDYYDPDDLLELPGTLLTQSTYNGIDYALVSSAGTEIYLQGPGYADDYRPTPFIDSVALSDHTTARIFEGAKESFDQPLVPLDADLQQLIVRREASNDFPDSYLWGRDGSMVNLTNNVDPFPEITAARRINYEFERRDGVKIRGRLSLPLDYVVGTRVPAVFWTYPREYDSVEEYEQAAIRSHNLNAHRPLSFRSNSEVWLTQGYALVVPDIPIIGQPYNDKYVQHLVDGMYAAIRHVDRMGYVDVDKLGHGGHSYGAFATANVLARAPFFKAGIAGDGAYNRSLTPTGFQSERRDIWEAPHIYIEMSPFFVADQIDTPLLMYHGMDDNNTGTWPIQSDRMIHALTALGKTAVLYRYPYESHAPRAVEQQLDLWARWLEWFDKYVKGVEEEELTDDGVQR
jgi:dipeptidyl aminopeptidase/acylaminoacyl peptidase